MHWNVNNNNNYYKKIIIINQIVKKLCSNNNEWRNSVLFYITNPNDLDAHSLVSRLSRLMPGNSQQ